MIDGHWLVTRDGDPRARWLYRHHYSYRAYADCRDPRLFVGPGEKLVLLTVDCRAVWVWRRFIDDSDQIGVNNALFRNESEVRSVELIREAVEIGRQRWPGQRFYTYVDPRKIESPNPGYCYKLAGWRFCGKTREGKHILELLPSALAAFDGEG